MREHYFVSDRACNDGVGLMVCPDTKRDAVRQKIAEMAVFSAPFTHPYGNRRLGDYVLQIKDRTVLRLRKLEGVHIHCPTCRDTKHITMWEECETCGGQGMRADIGEQCGICGGSKEVKRSHPCPECSIKKPVSRLGFK